MKEFFLTHPDLPAQAAGVAAMLLNVVSFQFGKHRKIMLLMTLSSVFWVLHYSLLGLFPAALINIMNMFRNCIYGLREKKNINSRLVPACFVVIAAVSVFATWENAWDILPLAASVTATVANWQTQTKKLRLLSIPRYALWAVYDTAGGAWAGLANDLFTIASIGVALLRGYAGNGKAAQPENGAEEKEKDGNDL